MKRLRLVDSPEGADSLATPRPLRRAGREEALLDSLGTLVASVGSDRFLDVLGELVGRQLRCSRWLAVRYRQFAKPDILIDRSLSPGSRERYLAGLYRLDPLLRLVSRGDVPPVVTFLEIRGGDPESEAYDDLFRLSLIHDELAVMLPDVGGSYLALCFDSERRSFTAADVLRVRRLFPVLAPLHRMHLERGLPREITAMQEGGAIRMAVTDAAGRLLHRSLDWEFPGHAEADRVIQAVGRGEAPAAPVRIGDRVLHWETLGADHAVAPGGRVFLVEQHSPGYLEGDAETALAAFARAHRLSPREREIVKLTLRGYPSSGIARKLDLTIGTVKNYKHRLYDKLDITSEREVFSRFIAHLFGQE